MQGLHDGRFDVAGGELYLPLVEATYRHLDSAIALGWHAADPKLRQYLSANVLKFSGFKTHAVMREMAAKLTDAAGQVRPFAAFRADALDVHDTYNVRYLRTEYESAVASAQMASKWAGFAPGALLRYDTAGDDRVRADHAIYDGKVARMDDPFWNSHYPPCDWACRCSVTEVGDDTPPTDPAELKALPPAAPEFRANVGKTGTVFDLDHHAYGDVAEKMARKIEAQLVGLAPPSAAEAAAAQYEEDVKTVFVGGNGMLRTRDRMLQPQWASRQPGLSVEEKAVLHDYTGSGYRVNRGLRGERPSNAFDLAYARLLDGALAKMPAFEGVVYRGLALSDAAIAAYRTGTTVTEAAFTSTSQKVGEAFDGNVRMQIKSTTGRNIESLSDLPHEAEVLFPQNSRFKVLSRRKKGGLTTIVLSQVVVP